MNKEKKEMELSLDYRTLEKWLGCPNCKSQKAKLEKGSLQLFCPNCHERQELRRTK